MTIASVALDFLHHYGYLALFVLMTLETAMILHFVPSELIVAVAAATLATGWGSLALVVAVATLASTAGALALYGFARYGGRPFFERYGKWFGLTPARLDSLHRTFERPVGESLVFFLRLLPVVRAAVSIPAGIARMDVRKFTLFSAAGSLLFNAAIAIVAFEAGRPNAFSRFLANERGALLVRLESWRSEIPTLAFVALVAALVVLAFWPRREALARGLHHVFESGARRLAIAMTVVAGILLLAALLAADVAYGIVAWLSIDIDDLAAAFGFSHAAAVVWVALSALGIAFLLLALVRLVRAVVTHRPAR
ncbi:MAG: DedA family protein [Thermoplasmatota archaeon]